MKFLRSRYVLILALAILVIEGAFLFGLYEPLVSPTSHAGRTISLLRALKGFGKEKIDVVTFGDSRTVQGLDNQLIYESSRSQGLEHIRMSMPGSHLLTFTALSKWSQDELPALQGIVFVLSPASFGTFRRGAYELAKVLPMRSKVSLRDMLHFVPFDRGDISTYANFSSLAGYREDIKDFLANPGLRYKALMYRTEATPLDFLNFSDQRANDLCSVPTDNPQACLVELKNRRDEISIKTWNALNTICSLSSGILKESAPNKRKELLLDEWTIFLEDLSQQVNVMLVVIPDHSSYLYRPYARTATWVSERLLDRLRQKDQIQVVDLSDLILKQENDECLYFKDEKHLNKLGQEVLTEAILPSLNSFWRRIAKSSIKN